jgi:hypothetical protein
MKIKLSYALYYQACRVYYLQVSVAVSSNKENIIIKEKHRTYLIFLFLSAEKIAKNVQPYADIADTLT